jgi:mono/diheme cytochrome c family protein
VDEKRSASPDLKDPFKKEPKPKKKPKPKPKPAMDDDDGDQEEEAEKPKAPAQPKGDAAAGQALFLKKCKSCHGADGKGESAYGQKIGVPNLVGTSLGKNAVRKAIRNGKSGTKMRGYASKLDEQEIEDLVAFIKSL